MRVFIEDLEVRADRLDAVRRHPQPRANQNHNGGEAAVATVWLAFYLLALATAATAPILSQAMDLAAR
jgi:hypothetical protein